MKRFIRLLCSGSHKFTFAIDLLIRATALTVQRHRVHDTSVHSKIANGQTEDSLSFRKCFYRQFNVCLDQSRYRFNFPWSRSQALFRKRGPPLSLSLSLSKSRSQCAICSSPICWLSYQEQCNLNPFSFEHLIFGMHKRVCSIFRLCQRIRSG